MNNSQAIVPKLKSGDQPSTIRRKIDWYAPTWSTAGKKWWAFRKDLLSWGPLVRISVASGVSTAIIVALFRWLVPGIVIPNLLPLLFVLPLLILQLAAETWMTAITRAHVVVTEEKITIRHRKSGITIKFPDLKKVTLSVHRGGLTRIRFDYTKWGKPRFKTLGITDEVDLEVLETLLPVPIYARDCRRGEREKLVKEAA